MLAFKCKQWRAETDFLVGEGLGVYIKCEFDPRKWFC